MALKSYEELIKVDVRQYCEERDGFTYLKGSHPEQRLGGLRHDH